jgi:hypothetical protein
MTFLTGGFHRLQHLSDETISRLISGELSSMRNLRTRAHIEKCWHCRSRREALERAAMRIAERRHRLAARRPLDPGRREMFLAEVQRRLNDAPRQSLWARFVAKVGPEMANAMNPIFVSVVIVSVAAVLLLWVWQRAARPIGASELLTRATASESVAAQQATGVIYQKVRITTAKGRVEREIYRDPRGLRRRRAEAIRTEEQPLQSMPPWLGVSWGDPLSASSFQGWRNRQAGATDIVHAHDGQLLTLVTAVPGGPIAQESLTVRESDFHPVGRTIELRDERTIEIAELSYDVLPWAAVNPSLFEPIQGEAMHPSLAASASAIHRLMPTRDALVTAELEARLALVQLRAINGEDIQVNRRDSRVVVQGIVDTDDRKQEIENAMNRIAFVKPELKSFEEMERMRKASQGQGEIEVHPGDATPSPLDKAVAVKDISQDEAVTISRTLTESSILIARESLTIEALDQRYGNESANLNDKNKQLLTALRTEHLSTLLQALTSEQSALAPYAVNDDSREEAQPEQLSILAGRNNELCKELVSGADNNSRRATAILHDLIRVSSQIRNTMNLLQKSPRP